MRIGIEVDHAVLGGDEPGDELTIVIPKGAGDDAIATILDDTGVVGSATTFKLRLLASGDGADFKPGTYTLRENEDYDVIVQKLSAGPPVVPPKRLVVPEGFAVRDIAKAVEKVGLTSAAYLGAIDVTGPPEGFLEEGEKAEGPDGPSLEGFLFPATYEVAQPPEAQALVDQQLVAFEDAFAQLDLSVPTSRKLTRYDVLIIASMIEREAAAPQDRAKIAAVIYNRLKEKMPLGIDPTIQYAIGSWRKLKPADLEIDSPYNSRTEVGLPPTPIANPGLASLQAAANPAKVDYLYFVAIPGDAKRRHFFTASYDAFLQYQQDHPDGQ